MKKFFTLIMILALSFLGTPALAKGTHGTNGKISAKSVGAAALSLIVWPGIGQAVNGQQYEKNMTHAILGLTGVFRFWSCYDALVDRNGGVWKNRI